MRYNLLYHFFFFAYILDLVVCCYLELFPKLSAQLTLVGNCPCFLILKQHVSISKKNFNLFLVKTSCQLLLTAKYFNCL